MGDFLQKALEKKRKEKEELLKKVKADEDRPKKYLRRGDLDKLTQEEKKEDPNLKAPEKKHEEPQVKASESVPAQPMLPKTEVIKRLRARNQPVTFFGETDLQREERLRQLEILEPEESSEQGRNDFKEAIKEIDDEDKEEDTKKAGEADEYDSEDEKGIPATDSPENLCSEDYVMSSFKRILRTWEEELNERPDTVKKSAQGKIQTATFKQTRKYLRPLFKLLRNRTLAEDIRDSLYQIAIAIHKRDYKRAGDIYLRLAIGNSPWPMGVTMVGIHERSAREKIFSNQIAHILNDETQRKYIQSVKRLMSFCQRKYPADPSRMVG